MILLVLETHGALHFSALVDEQPQRVVGQRMIIAAGTDIFELTGMNVMFFRVHALKHESLDFVGGVEGQPVLLVELGRILLQHGAQVAGVGTAVLVDHLAEYQDFARSKIIRRPPVERAPVHAEPQIAFLLRRESADGRPVKRQVVRILDKEFLVVVEHVQPAFEIAEQQRYSLDSFLVGQVLETFFLNLSDRNALHALFLGMQIQVFKLAIRQF